MDSKISTPERSQTPSQQPLQDSRQQLAKVALPFDLSVQLFGAFNGGNLDATGVASTVLALAEAEAHSFGEDQATAGQTYTLSQMLLGQGKAVEAEMLVRQNLASHRANEGSESLEVLRLERTLGQVLAAQGKLHEARALFIQCVEAQREVLGADSLETLDSLEALADLLMAQQDELHAEPFLCEALIARRRLQGDTHPDTLRALGRLAVLLQKQGRFERALPLLHQTLGLQTRLLGAEHNDTLVTMGHLAGVMSAKGNIADAEALLQRAYIQRTRSFGLAHQGTQEAALILAEFLIDCDRSAEARPILTRIKSLLGPCVGDASLFSARVDLRLGQCLCALTFYEAAQEQLTRGYDQLRSSLGLMHPLTQTALTALIGLYDSWGKPRQAEPLRAAHSACS